MTHSLPVVDCGDLMTMELKPRELLLDPWLIEQGLMMIHAWRGLGKTQVAMGAAMAIATGTAFLKWKAPRPRRVIYVDGELPLRVLQDRVRAARDRAGVKPAPGFLRFVTPDLLGRAAPDLADLKDQAMLDAAIGDAELVILDNLSCLIRSGGAENDAESWQQVSDWALHHRAAGRAVLFIHHSGKSGAQRGTSRREDLLDVVLSLRKPQEWEAKDGARFEVFEFTLNKPWPAGELIEDVRDGVMPFLEDIIDRIVGEDGSPAIKLGLWLEKHDGIEADGYRLDRVGKKRDVWLYTVLRV